MILLPPSEAYVRSFLYLFYTLIKLYYSKALSDPASSLALDWIHLLWRPRIPASYCSAATSQTEALPWFSSASCFTCKGCTHAVFFLSSCTSDLLGPALGRELKAASPLTLGWLFATPWTVAWQTPLSMGILQARILEWVSMPFSRESSQPRDWTQVFCNAGRVFTVWATKEAPLGPSTHEFSPRSSADELSMRCFEIGPDSKEHPQVSPSPHCYLSLLWPCRLLYRILTCSPHSTPSSCICSFVEHMSHSFPWHLAPSFENKE